MISIIKEKEVYIKNQQYKMNLYCIKCTKFTNNSGIKKSEIDGKISLYSCCTDRDFKMFETVDEN